MNIETNIFSKEAIKARMLQNATKIWGLKNPQSVDPFVKLLIEAFSTEIFQVNNEVNAINTRILEKVARLLTPNIYTFPRPAHAIAFTACNDATGSISHQSEFFMKKYFTSSIKTVSNLQLDINFTPVDNIQLVGAQIDLLLTGNTCYALDEGLNKQLIIKSGKKSIEYGSIVLGVDATNYTAEKLHCLSLYCSNPAFEHLDWVYQLLPFIKISHRNQQLKVQSGLSYLPDDALEGYEALIKNHSILKKIQDNIKGIYTQQFIELSGFQENFLYNEEELPDFIGSFGDSPELHAKLQGKKMIWLKLDFPPQFTSEILDSFSFALNAFPIYNRAWKQHQSTLDITGTNIPLITTVGEHFLSVEEIADGKGRKYNEVPFTLSGGLKQGLYTTRLGGMERFNERNAVDSIAHVLELTRDEVAAFGNMDKDAVVNALKEMIIQMKLLDRTMYINSGEIQEEMNYVIVEPLGNTDHLYASYWVTNCDMANKIRVGTKMISQSRSLEKNRTIIMLTETSGGEKEQTGLDAIQAYKYALTARDKIISAEDIKNFCHLSIGKKLKDIQVKRGTTISVKPKEGFIRTLEIEITPHNYEFMGENYWLQTAKELRSQIILRAIDGIEYVVTFINKDAAV